MAIIVKLLIAAGMVVVFLSLEPPSAKRVVYAGYCAGGGTKGYVFWPNPSNCEGWYCTDTYVDPGCQGKSYDACIAVRPDGGCPREGAEVQCVGCGWRDSPAPTSPPGGPLPTPVPGTCDDACDDWTCVGPRGDETRECIPNAVACGEFNFACRPLGLNCSGCSGGPPGDGGDGGPVCRPNNDRCENDSDCCSGLCSPSGSCDPTCRDVPPDDPTLTAPPDKAVLPGASTTLTWKHDQRWGVDCGNDNEKSMEVYVGTDADNLARVASLPAQKVKISPFPYSSCPEVSATLASVSPLNLTGDWANNWGGLSEKWFTDSTKQDYYIHPLRNRAVVRRWKGNLTEGGANPRGDTKIADESLSCYRAIKAQRLEAEYNYPYTGAPGQTYYWQIFARRQGRGKSDVWSFSFKPSTQVTVSGRVYKGQGGYTGFGKCIDPSGTATAFAGGSQVRVNPDAKVGSVLANGSYQVNLVLESGLKTITLAGVLPGYQCTCPVVGCQYSGAAISGGNNTGWNFYVSNLVAKWAQVVGGHVHGQDGATVKIPTGNNFLIPASFTNNKSGAASKTNGGFNTLPGGLSANWSLMTDKIGLSTWRYSYHRLRVRAGSPTGDPGNGFSPPAAGIWRKTGDFSVNSSGWQNLAGSRVIFVDGDLTVKYKVKLRNPAQPGDFLAFIVQGDISVDPGVGDNPIPSPAPGDADLVGAFLADGSFNGGSTGSQADKQLVIYGTIAADIGLDGAGRVRFQRDMGANNAVGPGVAVIWNPNLLLNFPDQLTDALTDWREVAP